MLWDSSMVNQQTFLQSVRVRADNAVFAFAFNAGGIESHRNKEIGHQQVPLVESNKTR